jgi:hypothetical protein
LFSDSLIFGIATNKEGKKWQTGKKIRVARTKAVSKAVRVVDNRQAIARAVVAAVSQAERAAAVDAAASAES